ncbi:brix domain protein [Dictyocaulus viviparus]|uniref:Brix domain protein n=1 Tax=Dictyocaulus viviparus TaxID=29172 RepID=A0A0D8XLF9_DICVI|nr:brix domain protein [Dictyocaulus viviparus]
MLEEKNNSNCLETEKLLKKYDEVKRSVTAKRADFKTLPKCERGPALRRALKKNKRARQAEREKIREALGDNAPAKEVPKTIESTREYDETMVDDDDEEVKHDEANDEFAHYYNSEIVPKVLITMSPFAKKTTWKFCFELRKCIPNAEIFARKGVPLKKVVKQASMRLYSDLIIVHEDRKKPSLSLLLNQCFRITHQITFAFHSYYILIWLTYNHCFLKLRLSEMEMLTICIARMFGCLFPRNPKYVGRRVVTFHNQRDYIFFRHHRYRFVWGKDAVGPHVPVGFKMGAPENPELHTHDAVYRGTPSKGDKLRPDFIYRAPCVGTTYIERCVTKFISALLWFWLSYNLYYNPGHIFGHFYMPYLHEFTDEELGIPPDSAPDPEYWGNHDKKYGTYR